MRQTQQQGKAPQKLSLLEETLATQIKVYSLPEPVREYRFHPTRKWRFDFAWPVLMIAVEAEGTGRHQSFMGFQKDAEKYNEASRLGWTVYRFTTRHILKTTYAIDFLREVLKKESYGRGLGAKEEISTEQAKS